MRKQRVVMRILAAMVVAFGACATAQARSASRSAASSAAANAAATSSAAAADFEGFYPQVNNDLNDEIVYLSYDGEDVFLTLNGLYEAVSGYHGTPENVRVSPESLSFDCVLAPEPGTGGPSNVPAHITLTRTPSDLYTLDVAVKGASSPQLAWLQGTKTLYKTDGSRIAGEVPVRLGEKTTVAGLIKALVPYAFTPEMMSMLHYLRTHSGLADTEAVRQDERNRYLEYVWGSENRCMECKYWTTSDGNVLFVVNTHDPTYQAPQWLRFLLFDKRKGTVKELPTALSARWPVGDDGYNDGICYQVRYSSDGIVALVPQPHGDSFDIVTLKFDGQKFN